MSIQPRIAFHTVLTLIAAAIALLALIEVAWAAPAADNPCGLLTAAEVEAVLGEPLAGPPYRARGTEPSATGDRCRYETSSFRALEVEVDWAGGGQAFGLMNSISGAVENGGLKGVLTLSDGTTLRGAWDEARQFMCCQFHALYGDTRVVVDVAETNATIEAAAGLADKAVQRLDQPLPVDAETGIAEAAERGKQRPAIASACTLVSRAEAEELVGAKLAADPDGAESGCTYTWTPEGTDYQQDITISVTWRDGFGEMRRTMAAIGMGLDMLPDAGLDLKQNSDTTSKAFDAYAVSIIGVMAVRKDVLLSIESGPMSEMAAKFIAVAAAKL